MTASTSSFPPPTPSSELNNRPSLQEGWAVWYQGYNEALAGHPPSSKDERYVKGYRKGKSVKHGDSVHQFAFDSSSTRNAEAELQLAVDEIERAKRKAVSQQDREQIREAEKMILRGRLETARSLVRSIQPGKS